MAWLHAVPPWAVALPWLFSWLYVLWSIRDSRTVGDYPPMRAAGAPRVSVIVPARDEALNIERCVRSLLLTTYANVEFIIVDDHSTDGTGDIAWRAINGDARARITSPPPLPDGWFGKQWACAHGASLATGELLLFTDADTCHSPDILARTVTALRERRADLLSVIGHQETVTFWEKVGQSAVFATLFAIVGSTEHMSRSRMPMRKAANGQYLLMRRDTYDAQNGHAGVRHYVAEDIMFAMTWTAAGREVHALMAFDHLSTRMYRSLAGVIQGWRKNVWAAASQLIGNRPLLKFGARVVFPIPSLAGLVPAIALVLGATGLLPHWYTQFGLYAYIYETVLLALIFRASRFPVVCALLYPLGALLGFYIFTTAAIRGDRTEWKGRTYTVA
jgi:chlorobactene glucosyltransferase